MKIAVAGCRAIGKAIVEMLWREYPHYDLIIVENDPRIASRCISFNSSSIQCVSDIRGIRVTVLLDPSELELNPTDVTLLRTVTRSIKPLSYECIWNVNTLSLISTLIFRASNYLRGSSARLCCSGSIVRDLLSLVSVENLLKSTCAERTLTIGSIGSINAVLELREFDCDVFNGLKKLVDAGIINYGHLKDLLVEYVSRSFDLERFNLELRVRMDNNEAIYNVAGNILGLYKSLFSLALESAIKGFRGDFSKLLRYEGIFTKLIAKMVNYGIDLQIDVR